MDPKAGGLEESAFEKAKWGGGETKGVTPPLDGGGVYLPVLVGLLTN